MGTDARVSVQSGKCSVRTHSPRTTGTRAQGDRRGGVAGKEEAAILDWTLGGESLYFSYSLVDRGS